MACAPRVSVALDPGSPTAGNRLFGVMVCHGGLSAPTDGVDLRGEVRTSSFFPLPGDGISLAISALDGSFGLRGVIGERTSTGRYRVTWTGAEVMPLEGEELLTTGVRCPPSLWSGWPQ
jgi:hypothetical protein